MVKPKGVRAYKKFWEDQAEFMDKEPWAKGKVAKLNFLPCHEDKLEALQFSDHSIYKEGGQLLVRIKVPYNYLELDDFETKTLYLLGIRKEWIFNIDLEDAHFQSSCW